jgi:hypothetical protein
MMIKPRHPEAERRRNELDGERHRPEHKASAVADEGASEPENSGNREPNRNPLEVAGIARGCFAKRPDHEEGAPNLHENIGCGKGEPVCAEGVRNRH